MRKGLAMALSVVAFLMIIFSSLTFSCSKEDDCKCNGYFKIINETIIVVPEVDCKTGEPGFTYPFGTGTAEAEFLGCSPY